MHSLVRRYLKTAIGLLGIGLAIGLWMIARRELARTAIDAAWLRWAIVACGFAQVTGIALFFTTMWSRIRPVGSQSREARGEKF